MSALTRATPQEMYADTVIRGKLADVMREATTVAAALDVNIGSTVEAELQLRSRGSHITPMLRDALAGRTLELDALTGAIVELGQITSVPTRTIL